MITLGIDVGGTKIAAGAVDGQGEVRARRQIATEADNPQAIVAGIAKVAKELQAAAPAATAIGVGAAGLIDAERGIVRTAPNIAWQDLHLRDLLQDRLGLPVVVDNDANVAAWGESLYGAGRGAHDQVMVTVGTGIGGGLVIGGQIYRGARGLGAELGHIILNEGGAPCACGNRGCFEAMASGNSIGRRARERAAEPEAKTVLEMAGGDVDGITGEMVGDAAKKDDAFALSIFDETGLWLGVGLASIVNLLDPDVIVVGGGAAAGTGELLLKPARTAMTERVIGHHRREIAPVVPARLGYDAGLIGAAALARALA